MLSEGMTVRIDNEDEPLVVVGLIGGGGEGDVYELADRDGGRASALKWFHEHTSTPIRRAQISALVERGSPSDRFLWPRGIIDDPSTGRFGYVMDLRPPEYVGLAALLRGEVPRLERAVLRFTFELAHSFMALHTRGLCYRDINFGNAFMHGETGQVLICDNDNVGVDGVSEALVLGSKKFMAPEIVRGEALPSKLTDRYSLAVMLFYLLFVHHPLEGVRSDEGLSDPAADRRNFGDDPRFCFDPTDDCNRPAAGFHDHVEPLWRSYDDRIRSLFTHSFTVGLHSPRHRVVDSEWCAALADLRCGSIICDNCERACFVREGMSPSTCPHCRAELETPTVLEFPGGREVVRDGAVISSHHLRGDLDFDTVVGTIETHPADPDRLGLRNDGESVVRYIDPDGSVHDVAPGRRADIKVGAGFEIDGVRGTVVRPPTTI